MMRRLLSLLALVAVPAVAVPPRVALFEFQCDEPHYRSWRAAADATAVVQAALSGDEAFVLVERAELDRLLDELQLGGGGLLRGADAPRLGRLARADWAVFGRFGTNAAGRRPFSLELVDLVQAGPLAETNLVLEAPPGSRLVVDEAVARRLTEALGGLLRAAAQETASPARLRVGFMPSADPALAVRLREAEARVMSGLAGAGVQSARFTRAGRGLAEAELDTLGLVEDAGSRSPADALVWLAGGPVPTLWLADGQAAARTVDEAALTAALRERAGAAERAFDAARRAEAARQLWTGLAGVYRDFEEFIGDPAGQAAWFQLVTALEALCLLDPALPEAREALVRVRWHPMAGHHARSEFRFQLRRSAAWG
jgi:hypothetical protein